MLHAVVMAGGSGTRFWPMSRSARPKQLLSLVTERPLLEETVARLEGLVPGERVHVVTNAAYADRTREMLSGVPPRQVIAEPCGRDTAACIALASALIARKDEDAVLAVLPADHVVSPAEAFRAALAQAAAILDRSRDTLVTFGITPSRPATGYGYIERGEARGDAQGATWYRVDSFREKPDEETAKRFLADGRFLWNAGIFVFRATSMLDRISRYLPNLAAALPAVVEELESTGAISTERYASLEKISIDYGVFEKDDDVAVLEATFGWDDVGSFAALERVLEKDAHRNCGVGPRITTGARDNVVVTSDDHHVALLGVEGLVVVHTPDATLVCRKEDAENVKALVTRLQEEGREGLL